MQSISKCFKWGHSSQAILWRIARLHWPADEQAGWILLWSLVQFSQLPPASAASGSLVLALPLLLHCCEYSRARIDCNVDEASVDGTVSDNKSTLSHCGMELGSSKLPGLRQADHLLFHL